MNLTADKLAGHLASKLASAYLVTGDEPLLVGEALDQIRQAARSAGFDERALYVAERGFDWGRLREASSTLSLFASRRIVEVRLPTGKPGTAGSKAIAEAMAKAGADTDPDTLFVFTAPKLDRSSMSTAWVKAIGKAGVVITVRPVTGRRLPQWIAVRMREAGLKPDGAAVTFLADRVEGNLLAAQQEIDKLVLLHGTGKITRESAQEAVADSARFDVFQLVDAAVGGDATRALRIVSGLKAEGDAPTLVLWALSREIRTLHIIAMDARDAGVGRAMAAARVWDSRKPVISKALARHDVKALRSLLAECAGADRVIKGRARGDAWQSIERLVARLAGLSLGVAA